jgi:LCP family protein required for cell wall assembly
MTNQSNYQQPYHAQSDPVDPWAETQVIHPAQLQAEVKSAPPKPAQRSSCCLGYGCLPFIVLTAALLLAVLVYFFAPGRTNILMLGIDFTGPNNSVGRSDTNVLTTIVPVMPYVGMLSIPRDLWVDVPGVGENRINTAHFFAEAASPGSGPAAAVETVRQNFGIDLGYYIRIKFDGFRDVFDALGGIDITLAEPMSGYPAGRHHLTSDEALAFVRDRAGTDDFFRMARGQLILKATFRQLLTPAAWVRLPAILSALPSAVDTNIPFWVWPRLAFTLLRVGPEGIDNRTINRNMVTPFITNQGASVLLPNWDAINPVLLEMFNQ